MKETSGSIVWNHKKYINKSELHSKSQNYRKHVAANDLEDDGVKCSHTHSQSMVPADGCGAWVCFPSAHTPDSAQGGEGQ